MLTFEPTIDLKSAKGDRQGKKTRPGERLVSTVWLLPSIMAIWFANGSKRRPEPFLPTISLHFAAGEHSPLSLLLSQPPPPPLPARAVSHIEMPWVNICLRSCKLILFKCQVWEQKGAFGLANLIALSRFLLRDNDRFSSSRLYWRRGRGIGREGCKVRVKGKPRHGRLYDIRVRYVHGWTNFDVQRRCDIRYSRILAKRNRARKINGWSLISYDLVNCEMISVERSLFIVK